MTKPAQKVLWAICSLFLVVATLVNLSAGQASGEVKLYLSPASASVNKNDTLTLSLREDSGDEPVNAMSTNITYSVNSLQLISIVPSAQFSIYDYDYGEGVINVNYQATTTPNTDDQLVATIQFEVIASSGSFEVTLDPVIGSDHSTLISSNSHTNVLTAVYSGSYNVSNSSPPPAAQTPGDTAGTGQSPTLTTSLPSDEMSGNQTDSQAARNANKNPEQISAQLEQQSGMSSRLNEILLWAAASFVVLASLISRSLRSKRKSLNRHESVADIAARLYSPNKYARETIAEVAARINRHRIEPGTETVAELATRISRVAKKKSVRAKIFRP